MSYWLIDPELFLYAKGTGPDDVHLWRCKKPVSISSSSSSDSSLVVPMKPDDFEYVETVKNHLELIGDMFDWYETDYKRLVKYIFEWRLLVNSQGFIIAELHKADKDGNKMIDEDANKEVTAIYIRSLDVLPLKPYIPNIRERLIPLRTVKCLEDVNGKAAAMVEEKDSNEITKLTARVNDLESKNETLGINITKLTADQVAMTDTIDDLKSENKTLATDLVTQMNALTTLQQKVKNINPNYTTKEVWMNDLTNSEWVDAEGLKLGGQYKDLIILGYPGTFKMDDSSTNVRARYWYKVNPWGDGSHERKAIFLEDMTPNKERARFSQDIWYSILSKDGKTYACRN